MYEERGRVLFLGANYTDFRSQEHEMFPVSVKIRRWDEEFPECAPSQCNTTHAAVLTKLAALVNILAGGRKDKLVFLYLASP